MQLYFQLSASLFSIIVGLISFQKKSISVSGFVALLVISHVYILLNQLIPLSVIFVMFASSSIISKYKKSLKQEFYLVNEKNGPRDYIQAIANLGASTICILAYAFCGNESFLFAFLCSVSSANADSWASEIGGLSKQKPVSIANFKPLDKGISGGITLLGTLGGLFGSFGIVGMYFWFSTQFSDFTLSKFYLIWAIIFGFVGMILDSVLGANFQALYKSEGNHLLEFKSENNTISKGFEWINNDIVNTLSTVFIAIISFLFYWFCEL